MIKVVHPKTGETVSIDLADVTDERLGQVEHMADEAVAQRLLARSDVKTPAEWFAAYVELAGPLDGGVVWYGTPMATVVVVSTIDAERYVFEEAAPEHDILFTRKNGCPLAAWVPERLNPAGKIYTLMTVQSAREPEAWSPAWERLKTYSDKLQLRAKNSEEPRHPVLRKLYRVRQAAVAVAADYMAGKNEDGYDEKYFNTFWSDNFRTYYNCNYNYFYSVYKKWFLKECRQIVQRAEVNDAPTKFS